MTIADAPVVVNYGESGRGKSTDLVYSLAGGGLFLGMPGGLRVAGTVVGFDISAQIALVTTMEEVPGYLIYARDNGFTSIGIDDASLLMQNTMLNAQTRFKSGDGYDFAMYPYLGGVLQQVVLTARMVGIPVVMNCHEQPGFTDPKTGEKYLAGPDFGWKKLVKRMPHMADISKRVVDRPFGVPSWDTRADCDNNGTAYMKDRYDVAPIESGPLNTSEHLLAGGWKLPKPAGLEWLDDISEVIAQDIASGATQQQATKIQLDALSAQKVNPLHIRWALRDGAHRAVFRLNRAGTLLNGF